MTAEHRSGPFYPSTADWSNLSEDQRSRAERSFARLRERCVPVFSGPLVVDAEADVKLQTPQDVARRTLVLWAVELRAEGMAQEEARGMIETLDLWDSVSERERAFLSDANPSENICQSLVWRLEAIWVLMWSLGYIEELSWPARMCDVDQLARLLIEFEDDPSFIVDACLRSTCEILDAQDLTMRIMWALRDAALHNNGLLPENLDWSGQSEITQVNNCAAVGVVEQRHYALNWLVNFLHPQSWDHVKTPT